MVVSVDHGDCSPARPASNAATGSGPPHALSIGPVVNALRDLKAKRAGLPLWQLLSRLSPEEIVDLVDLRYLTDALRPAEALGILQRAEPGPRAREERLRELGYPTYTTTPGWLGYDDQKLYRLCREAVSEGFRQVKLKVGADLDADIRRMALARRAVGPDVRIAIDANQRWDVDDAVAWVEALAEFDPW
jgi:L-fuconate dehydratase